MKFKVGDRVRIVASDGEKANKIIGQIGIVKEIDVEWVYPYELVYENAELQVEADGGWLESLFGEDEIELADKVELVFDKPTYASIKFQEGTVEENGVNGVQIEDVIDILVARLEGFQKGGFPCRENALAITKLEEARMWLNERTRKRKEQGVEGKNVKHQ